MRFTRTAAYVIRQSCHGGRRSMAARNPGGARDRVSCHNVIVAHNQFYLYDAAHITFLTDSPEHRADTDSTA